MSNAEDVLGMLHNAPTPCVITDAAGTQMLKMCDDPNWEQYFDVRAVPDFPGALRLVPPLDFGQPLTAENEQTFRACAEQQQRDGVFYI